MLTLDLSTTLQDVFTSKYYTKTLFRLKVSISIKGLRLSSIGKTMTRDLCF